MVEGVRICSPGFVTVDHQMDFNSWLGMDSKNVISGSIATTPEGLTPAQKFVNLAIGKGQERAERCFGTTCAAWGSLAQLPLVRGNTKHSHDLLLTVLPLKMRAFLHETEHRTHKHLHQPLLADAGTCKSKEKETFDKRFATKPPSVDYTTKQARPALPTLRRYEGPALEVDPAPGMSSKEKARMDFFYIFAASLRSDERR